MDGITDPLTLAAQILAGYRAAAEKAGITIPCLEADGNREDAMVVTEDGSTLEIRIHGPLDGGWYGASSKEVAETLDEKRPDNLKLVITSPGGIAFEGMSMYADLVARKKDGMTIEASGRGLVASAAVLPFLAADTRTVEEGTLMMIHQPWGGVFSMGTAKELLKDAQRVANALNAIDGEYSGIVASRTKTTKKQTNEWLEAETWFDSKQAVEQGFAQKATDTPKQEAVDPALLKQARIALTSFRLSAQT